ncbi:MAG TPA: hypothetical protein PLU35_12045 [Phycisphaerales bacterium]|nr:hypothetical protein [Phycisphaerales bacterium]
MYKPWVVEGETPWEPDDYYGLSAFDADRFTAWFVDSAPDRVAALESFIVSTPGFEGWRADGSRASFVPIGLWFLATVKALRTPERGLVYADRPLARSVSADIGTYMAEALRREGSRCAWERCDDHRDRYHNHPVLVWPKRRGKFCPIGTHIGDGLVIGALPTDYFAVHFDELLVIATYEPREYPPVPEREGKPESSRCPRCGFGFGRVAVAEGVYCNHCGELERRGT